VLVVAKGGATIEENRDGAELADAEEPAEAG